MTENIDRILPSNLGKEVCNWITFMMFQYVVHDTHLEFT